MVGAKKKSPLPVPELSSKNAVAVVGAGPAGLMAATVLARSGVAVELYDRMPRPGLKFLVAGRGGLNLTREESADIFAEKYGKNAQRFARLLADFSPIALRDFFQELGFATFVGTSRRVFPCDPVTAHILTAWMSLLADLGVRFLYRHQWVGFIEGGGLIFSHKGEHRTILPTASILALGGASWPRTGSLGDWVDILRDCGIDVTPLVPANCGFEVRWSTHFCDRYAGIPLKNLRLTVKNGATAAGDLVVTSYGIEGGAVYQLCPFLRQELTENGLATVYLDLKPDLTPEVIFQRLAQPWGKESMANILRKRLKLTSPIPALLRECGHSADFRQPRILANSIKKLPLLLTSPRPLTEAISTAGGVAMAEVDEDLMLTKQSRVFLAGEMLDWEAPTGGYLLQAAFSTGYRAAQGVLRHLNKV